jgi:disease resistance protein RPM1
MDRYFIVIDDIWEPQSWETIKLALAGNNCGTRVIITTRKIDVAKEDGEVYRLQTLPGDDSKRLFYTRLFCGEDKCPNIHPDELSDRVLKKCVGFCQDMDDRHMDNTMHILSLSYYDLSCHLNTCLLYLSIFPEDSLIHKYPLI